MSLPVSENVAPDWVRRLALTLLLLVVAGLLAAWWIDRGGIFPTERRNYRFQVTVDTPEGRKTAYSVHELTVVDTTMTPSRNYQIDLVGEAVPFTMEDGRILLAALVAEDTNSFLQVVGSSLPRAGYATPSWIAIPEEFDARVPPEFWPRLALIDAADEPETLRMLDGRRPFPPGKLSTSPKALEEIERLRVPDPAEADFRVVGARLVSTDEQMTTHVASLLPWLTELIEHAPSLSSQTTERHNLAFVLRTGRSK